MHSWFWIDFNRVFLDNLSGEVGERRRHCSKPRLLWSCHRRLAGEHFISISNYFISNFLCFAFSLDNAQTAGFSGSPKKGLVAFGVGAVVGGTYKYLGDILFEATRQTWMNHRINTLTHSKFKSIQPHDRRVVTYEQFQEEKKHRELELIAAKAVAGDSDIKS